MTTVNESISARIDRVAERHFGPGWRAELRVRAPGRIEVLGNHVDYNGGPVLAAAIDREIHIAARETTGRELRIVFPDVSDSNTYVLQRNQHTDWRINQAGPRPVDYVRGVIGSLSVRGLPMRSGLEMVVTGNLPPGLGISSSAALCVALTLLLAQTRPADNELVLLAQDAEHRVGSPCGTMDQATSVAGGLIEYSGTDNSVSPVEGDLEGLLFVVLNSGVEHNLATSSYPVRVQESKLALAILNETHEPPLSSLSQLKVTALAKAEALLENAGEPALAARVRHVVTECDRVRRASAAIARSDWSEVGRLMTASGESSARDYAISHPAVEEIVRICLGVEGVLGSRMMGGGEGGAALVLIRREALEVLSGTLERSYFGPRDLRDRQPRIVPCIFAQGAGFIDPGA